ncbi:MAG: hypothetical protein IJU61_09990 [Victivallales bacterium]|nr:hypothetical protein [Victivallales bacterium]
MIFSFDIFDTVIGRRVQKPVDIFHLMSARLLENHPEVPHDIAENFYDIRRKAEADARKASSAEDITFDDIYDQLAQTCSLSKAQRDFLQAFEFNLELENIRPIRSNDQMIHDLLAKGERVIFISDMYLQPKYIKQLLAKVSPVFAELPLYVSNACGLMKQTGSLFKYVLKQENIRPEELIHRGDNPVADLEKPRSLGILTDFYDRSVPSHWD